MWKETTDQRDPTIKDGEWSLELPWLKSNYAPSRLSIRRDRSYFVTCFWHGNQGHDFDGHWHYLDLDSAKEGCSKYVKKMLAELAEFVTQL